MNYGIRSSLHNSQTPVNRGNLPECSDPLKTKFHVRATSDLYSVT